MKVEVHILTAFAKTKRGGNPAGVVLNADYLSTKQIQEIAGKVGLSETAFISKSKNADFKLRFFTPNKEVDLCGHATIAAFSLLRNNGVKPGKYTQETKSGVLVVEVKENIICMEQSLPKFGEILEKKEIARALTIKEYNIADDLPIQIVSTGLRDILIPIKELKTLQTIKPDFDRIIELSKKHDIVSLHPFSLETLYNSTAHCRNFAPLYDIPEESATGTSSGALACYLYKYKVLKKRELNNIVFEQGYSMDKPSEIVARLTVQRDKLIKVQVGGTAILVEKKLVNI